MNTIPSLNNKQKAIVTISAFTATGNLQPLRQALNEGLDAGLTISEIKEVQVQLYAYAGFPRSLNGLQTFMDVLKERKQKGIADAAGKAPSPLPAETSRLQFGTDMQTKLVGQPVRGALFEFAPAIDQFLKEHLFGDIFGRDNLDWKTRELATIAALASLGNVDNQLRSHIGVGIYNGLTEDQLHELVAIIQTSVGAIEGSAASQSLQAVLAGRSNNAAPGKTTANTNTLPQANQHKIFAKGEKITNDNFTGNAWLHQMTTADSSSITQVGNVTFEARARTKWHLHPAGQILLITSGTGYYQEKGSSKRVIKKGDVVNCPPGIPHWHGASKDEELVQVAITATHKGPVVWMEAVTEEDYYK